MEHVTGDEPYPAWRTQNRTCSPSCGLLINALRWTSIDIGIVLPHPWTKVHLLVNVSATAVARLGREGQQLRCIEDEHPFQDPCRLLGN